MCLILIYRDVEMETEAYTLPVFGISRHRMNTDGQGVTTLIGAVGCELRCRYCANPIAWNESLPKTVKLLSAEELYDKVKEDNLYFLATGGGVTFGGGEGLLHAVFYPAFRKVCGTEWHLAVETSLNVSRELLKTSLDAIDEYIIDIKDINPEIYRAYTGQDNNQVLENLTFLLQHKNVENIFVRVPRIPKFNTDEDIEKTVEYLRQIGVKRIEVFPYTIVKN